MPQVKTLAPGARRIVFWLLLPVAAVQGLLLRRRALRLPPPPGDTHGQCGCGSAVIRVLAAGDSIIAGIGADHQLQALPAQFARLLAADWDCRVDWHSQGVNGANLASLLDQLSARSPESPVDIILLSIGVNDVTGLTSTRRWRQLMTRLLDTIHLKWPKALLVFTGLPPMEKFPLPPQPLRMALGWRARMLDQLAADVLATQDRTVHIATEIDPHKHGFCADGFHPSGHSYEIWATGLVQRLQGYNGLANQAERPMK